MRTEVRIAGFGGQGVIMAGVIIGKAASLFDNKNAVQTQSYGPEARGGASRTEVVIDDDEIDYPKVTSPDILVAMSHEALIKYMGDLKEEHKIKLYRAPATKTATEDVGLRIVANIVMIGAIVKVTEVVSVDAAKQAILDSVPKGTEDKNIQIFIIFYFFNISNDF